MSYTIVQNAKVYTKKTLTNRTLVGETIFPTGVDFVYQYSYNVEICKFIIFCFSPNTAIPVFE
jgi:hypothetical protein